MDGTDVMSRVRGGGSRRPPVDFENAKPNFGKAPILLLLPPATMSQNTGDGLDLRSLSAGSPGGPSPARSPARSSSFRRMSSGNVLPAFAPQVKYDDENLAQRSLSEPAPARSPARSSSFKRMASGSVLSEATLREYREAFALFDKDKDGYITKHELMTAFSSVGARPVARSRPTRHVRHECHALAAASREAHRRSRGWTSLRWGRVGSGHA